ncbi:MAG: YicC family protein [Clostridia bacterium]|nr:YicC family protein [Clostridia bacterium]MBQ8858161.1 YicC family protein [Clostridia bacterium]
MIKSMTAFGRAVVEGEDKDITVEIRSVNSRYYDCNVRLPRTYSFMEEKIKAYIQRAVSRAKVDVSVSVEHHGTDLGTVDVDLTLARGYVDALRRLQSELGLVDDITTMQVAANRDLFTYTHPAADTDGEWARVEAVLATALADYTAMREAEGQKTEADIREKLEKVKACAATVAEISRTDITGYRDRLETRLRGILGEGGIVVDEARLLTECAVFADKIAIDEEIARLGSHFCAFDEICRAGEPSGRKLDFLMQEMNRETNTIGSKAGNARIARLVVEMKAELEKIREQIQNIE